MDSKVPDEIIRTITLKVPQTKVWRAIADAQHFGAWFHCTVDGPFEEGGVLNCRSTYGVDSTNEESNEFVWQKRIVSIQPERYFAFEWTPGDTGANLFAPEVGTTLVEFTLHATDEGTRLVVRESGFASLPEAYRERSFRLNSGGWDAQVENISVYFHAKH